MLLDDGRTVTADESYVRESILNPGAKIVSGFKNIMPTFQGQLSEEEVIGLVAYVKALGNGTANLPLPVSNPDSGNYPVAPKAEPSAAKSDQDGACRRARNETHAGRIQRRSSRGSNHGNSEPLRPKRRRIT